MDSFIAFLLLSACSAGVGAAERFSTMVVGRVPQLELCCGTSASARSYRHVHIVLVQSPSTEHWQCADWWATVRLLVREFSGRILRSGARLYVCIAAWTDLFFSGRILLIMLAARRQMARTAGAVARKAAPMARAPVMTRNLALQSQAAAPTFMPVWSLPASRRMMSSPAWVEHPDQFHKRHNGIVPDDEAAMCKLVGVKDIDQLMDETVPTSIRNRPPLAVGKALTETEALQKLEDMVSTNQIHKSYIGMGYYNTITPPPILRNIIQNPGWYTPYTPYQAEISQGRMESLVNYQTMISDLTGMKIAQASLLVSKRAPLLYTHTQHVLALHAYSCLCLYPSL